jgi:hypothetical protein
MSANGPFKAYALNEHAEEIAMALLDEFVESDIAKGVALGAGVALAVPVLLVALWPMVKPVARTAVKAGLLAFEKGREGMAELSEEFEDLVAETREELRTKRVAREADVAPEEESESGGMTDHKVPEEH